MTITAPAINATTTIPNPKYKYICPNGGNITTSSAFALSISVGAFVGSWFPTIENAILLPTVFDVCNISAIFP